MEINAHIFKVCSNKCKNCFYVGILETGWLRAYNTSFGGEYAFLLIGQRTHCHKKILGPRNRSEKEL